MHILILVCSFSCTIAHILWEHSSMHIPFWYVHTWVMCKHLKSYMHIPHAHTDMSLLFLLCYAQVLWEHSSMHILISVFSFSCTMIHVLWQHGTMHIPFWYVHICVTCKHQFLIPVEKILAEEIFLKSYMHIPHTHTAISLFFLLYYRVTILKCDL